MTLRHHAGYGAGRVYHHLSVHPQKKCGEQTLSSSHVVRKLFKKIYLFSLESSILYTMYIYHIHLLLRPSHTPHLSSSVMPSFSVAIRNNSLSQINAALMHMAVCPSLNSHPLLLADNRGASGPPSSSHAGVLVGLIVGS